MSDVFGKSRIMKITPLAADSLGTRSMATFVSTKDANFLIDPSTSLAPDRYGLAPHALEEQRFREHWRVIMKYAAQAEVVIITHYHYDHHYPKRLDVFRGKLVLIKHPEEKINLNQKRRAAEFVQTIKDVAKEIDIVDGKKLMFGKTRVEFSQPVFHGKSDKLGYVIEFVIQEDMRFVFTSDVQGPLHSDQLAFITREDPDIVYLDWPLTYMLGSVYKKSDLSTAILNIEKILTGTNLKTLIIDHHLPRDIDWRKKLQKIFDRNENKIQITTAAGFLGLPDDPLEAKRRILYAKPC